MRFTETIKVLTTSLWPERVMDHRAYIAYGTSVMSPRGTLTIENSQMYTQSGGMDMKHTHSLALRAIATFSGLLMMILASGAPGHWQ